MKTKEKNSTPLLFTKATDSLGIVSSGVDQRTGIYSVNLILAKLFANKGLGPDFDLILKYSPLSKKNYGFGQGFDIGVTTYDRKNKVLKLYTGEQYKISELSDGNNEVSLLGLKKSNFIFIKINDNEYIVSYKDGKKEHLTGLSDGHDIKVTSHIVSHKRSEIFFKWDFSGAEGIKLVSIYQKDDTANPLIKIDYTLNAKSTIHLFTNTNDEYVIELYFFNGFLTQMKKFGGNNAEQDKNNQEWHFYYTEDSNSQMRKAWGPWLEKVIYPGGMTEKVTYDYTKGHAFPSAPNTQSKLTNLPYVTVFEQFQDSKMSLLASKREFLFSSNNFLGANTDPSRIDQDKIMNGLEYIFCLWGDKTGDYTYQCIETRINDSDGKKQRTKTTSTYNIYHLLVEEIFTDDIEMITNKIEYYASTREDPTNQNSNFSMPKKSIQTIKNQDGKEINLCIETQYDNYENLLLKNVKNLSDGSLLEPSITIDYYSGAESETIDGIDLYCPAEPDGFIKFIKKLTITPMSTENNEESKTKYFTYKDIGSGVIMNIKEIELNSLNRITTTFFYETTSENFGMKSGEEFIINKSDKIYKSYVTYNYIQEPYSYTRYKTYVSHDNKKIISDKTISYFTGRTIKETTANGNITQFEYDYLGRLVNRKIKIDDTTILEDKYTYYIDTVDKYPLKTLHISPDGVQILKEFDSLGRIMQLRINKNNANEESFTAWPVTERYEYDLTGRIIKKTKLDYLFDENNLKKIMERSTQYKYDMWGNESLRVTNTGLTERIKFDPVAMTNTFSFTDSDNNPLLGEIIEQVNHLGAQVKVTHQSFDKKLVIESTCTRDGWNRVVKKTNANGNTFVQKFDSNDRIINETRYDGSQLLYKYADFSTESYLESLEIETNIDHIENNIGVGQLSTDRIMVGKKRYDGLGRLTENKVYGRRWSYEYDTDNSVAPNETTDPSGIVKVVNYTDMQDPKVKEVFIKKGTIKRSIESFTYNKISSAILEGITGKYTLKRTYDKIGHMKSDTLLQDGGTVRNVEYVWSLCGLLYSITDVQSFKQEHKFDDFGRVIEVLGDNVNIVYKYDELSRITTQTVLNNLNKHCIETSIRYDDFGREVYRKINDTCHTMNSRVIKQSWDKMNRLLEKEYYTIQNETEIKVFTEEYTYNKDGTVSIYNCTKIHESGLQHIPTDKYGNNIYHETNDYDAYGNITKNMRYFMPWSENTDLSEHVNTTMFFYDTSEPTRLIKITNTHKTYPPSVEFEYDLNGNMTGIGANKIVYDDMGRVYSVNEKPYCYDALDRLVKVDNKEKLYSFRQLRAETGKGGSRASLFVGHHGAELHNNDILLTACDGKNSCIYMANDTKGKWKSYSLYGESSTSDTFESLFGFNGEHRDSDLEVYLLGAGYRFYSPSLMRFITPDSPFNSPLGAGGLNPYSYCLGDPVNNADPTGQISWQGWVSMAVGGIGLMMTVLTGGLSIVAASGILATSLAIGATAASLVSGVTAIVGTAISDVSPNATRVLRWVSLGTGLLSFSSGAAGMAQGLYKAMRELGLRTTLATMGVTSRIGLALNVASYSTATVSYGTSLIKRVLDHTALAQSDLNTIIGNISFGTGIASDAASISHFALSRAMPRSFSWDVPQSTTMDEISLRSLTPGANNLDANTTGSYIHYSEMLIPQINNFFLHIPLQARQ